MTVSRALFSAAVALLALTALPVHADTRTDADKHFRRGVELYKDKDFATALVEFQRAYEIAPDTKTLYNIAELQGQLQDYAGALKSFQRYLSEGGKKLPLQRKRDVEKEIDKLKQRVATLTVTTSEPGATVAIDDVATGTSPLPEPIVVSAGKRKVTATITGRPPVTEVLTLAGGDTRTLSLTIPPLETKVVVTREPPSLAGPVIAWAGTGVLTAGAVVTGIFALGASSDLKEKLAAYPGDAKAISSAHSKALAFGITNDVLSGLALAAGGVSIWLTVRQQRAASDTKTPAPAARLLVFPNGIGAAGSF